MLIESISNILLFKNDPLTIKKIDKINQHYLKKIDHILKKTESCTTLQLNYNSLCKTYTPAFSAILRTVELNDYDTDLCNKVVEEYNNWSKYYILQKNQLPIDDYIAPCGSYMITKKGERIENVAIENIILDFSFPLVWQHADIIDTEFSEVQSSDQKIALEKIESALKYLKRYQPHVLKFVQAQTDIIHVREAHNEVPASSSNFLRNGATVLRGVHYNSMCIEDVVECIVHEAIHHLIYKIEILEGEFRDLRSNARPVDKAVQSPWTGNTIALDSYIHAIYVWYGIFNFWSDKNHIDESYSLSRQIVAKRGFTRVSIPDFLNVINLELPKPVLSSLSDVQNTIQNSHINMEF